MPAKKRIAPAKQLSLEGAPPPKAVGAKRVRGKTTGAKTAGVGAAPKRRPRQAAGATESAGLAAAVRALEQVAENLNFTHESFALSLLRLPRADDYEPLTEALRRLAAAAPALVEALAPPDTAAPLPARDPGVSALARSAILAARDQLEAALRSLPRAADYEPAARNLREMASVSPSLMAWFQEVPALSTPLSASVQGLRAAIADLDRALEALDDEPAPAASRVKVVVRG